MITEVTVDRPEDCLGATRCRFCGAALGLSMIDLGLSPLCETLVSAAELERPEVFYPLHVRVCESCWLAQIPQMVPPDVIFSEYAYFSSYSDSWVEHARRYVEAVTKRLGLGPESFVVELGSNDGYLLQHFVTRGIPVLGVDPAENVVAAALGRGVPTLAEFFGRAVAEMLVAEYRRADLVVGNNVLAQVPDINDFVVGVATVLAPDGTATFEFPHLLRILEQIEYDTIYHEHFSYFSLFTIGEIFAAHGLAVSDVEELPTHGGSLRLYVRHAGEGRSPTSRVAEVLADEEKRGLRRPERYEAFRAAVHESKWALLELLFRLHREGKKAVGYGAPGKGNTLLNYCGIRPDLLEYTVDRNPFKQGKYTPGTHIPIHAPERIAETRPDVVVILPWNLSREISDQLAYTAEWGAKLAVPVPVPRLFDPGGDPNQSAVPGLRGAAQS